MGKPTGFLDFERIENGNVPPMERICNFEEFHPKLDEKARREQAARCMNCGVPMCGSAIKLAGMVTGCPLHNFIPEWNDALYQGQFDMAAWRLLKTSSFPEFTGRVCPALCEKACNCGNPSVGEGAVTVHDNELFIIEKAFETGYMKPQVPLVRSGKKVAVIGAGPAGLAVADALNRRGHSVTVYERDDKAGGLLMYGIPNMKLDKKIVDRRIELMKAEGVEFVFNADVGNGTEAYPILNLFDAVALCCGAKKARPLSAVGVEKIDADKEGAGAKGGIMLAVDFLKRVTKTVISSEAAGKDNADLAKMLYKNYGIEVEGKDVIVLGGGDTGNDCTGSVIRLGCKSVTQIEMMPCPPVERAENNPWPQWPKTLKTDYGAEESIAKFGHDPRVYKTTIKEVYEKDGRVAGIKTVQVEFRMVDGQRKLCEIEGSEKELPADLILIAAGFLGCEDYTAKAFGTNLTARNTVESIGEATPDLASPNGYKTSVEKVFTAGDMHRGQSLVVWAIAEGRECARQIDEYLMGYSNM
ncbi:MAG: glutamate synthase subunit beta [Treponema sp.]|nr:glutamate synthase subunit beta [Treponema sp.]